jgi:hypothetical protein
MDMHGHAVEVRAEAMRGCGFRVSGFYIMGGTQGIDCGKLPRFLTECDCCGETVKQSKGWSSFNPDKLFRSDPIGVEQPCGSCSGTQTTGDEICYGCGGTGVEHEMGLPVCSSRTESYCHLCPLHNPKMGLSGRLWVGVQAPRTDAGTKVGAKGYPPPNLLWKSRPGWGSLSTSPTTPKPDCLSSPIT